MKGQNLSAADHDAYIAALDEPRRSELATIHAFIRKHAKELEPVMIKGMLGYGPYAYRYASGHGGDWVKVALASNASAISLYVCVADEQGYLAERNAKRLGKASVGKSCIRFKRWADLDHDVVKELLRTAVAWKGPGEAPAAKAAKKTSKPTPRKAR